MTEISWQKDELVGKSNVHEWAFNREIANSPKIFEDYFVASSSVELPGNVSDCGHEVNGATGNKHGGLAGHSLSGGLVDALGGDGINTLAVLGEGKVTEGHEVAGNLLETLVLALKGHKDVHLEDVLGTGKLLVGDRLAKAVKLLEHDLEELSTVGARALDVHTEETGVGEVRVDSRGGVNEVVLLHQVGDSTAVHALAGTARAEGSGLTDEGLHEVEGMNALILPGSGLEDERDVGLRALSPGAVLATDVLSLFALVHMLGNTMELSETLAYEVNVLAMALDTRGNDEDLLGGDVVHHELLHHAGIEVGDVAFETEAGHTKRFVSVGSAEEEVLVGRKWVVLGQVVMQVVALLVLGAGDVSSHD